MTPKRGTPVTALYSFLRLTPIGLAFGILDLSNLSSEMYRPIIDQLLRLLLVLSLWTLAEGALMLWTRTKNEGSPNSRGYGIVSIIFVLAALFMLQVFRAQSNQPTFLALLAALAARGMARAGWEHGRAAVAFWTSLVGHSLTGALSFLIIQDSFPWQAGIVALAFGSSIATLDATWYGDKLNALGRPWMLAAYRVLLAFGPTAIATMALIGSFPRPYVSLFLVVFLASPLLKLTAKINRIPSEQFGSIAGICVSFIGMLVICFVYS